VQQFTEIFNKDTLGADSTAAKSSRSCITRATVEQLKSQAAVQLKQHNQQQQQEIKQKVMIL
jgi:hypothetical protein